MITETIYGQIIAKANHYMSVPGKGGAKRIIKDEKIREYERSFIAQCRDIPEQTNFKPFPAVRKGMAQFYPLRS